MDPNGKEEHPEDKVSVVHDPLLRWINPLIEIANKRTITEQDVWPCPKSENIQELTESFWKAWYAEVDLAEQQNRKADLFNALYTVFGSRLIVAGCFQFTFLVITFGQPFLIGQLVDYVQTGRGGIRSGIGYALAFASLSLIASFALSLTFDILRRLGVAVRSCLMVAVYEQALKLTTAARMKNTVGAYIPF
jgi:hypothetical protein